MEIHVQQRSSEWFELRKSVQLTASNFGEALGVGRGKPYDFLVYYLTEEEEEETSSSAQHGINMEVVISEMYQILTGNQTRETGFWIPAKGDYLEGLVGVSPDAVVLDNTRKPVGLCEFKAPVFSLYGQNAPHGIPRHYMAQIQGQMGVSKLPWCDFLAVCVKTKSLILKRVHYCQDYWGNASKMLKEFCLAIKEARQNAGNIEKLNNEFINQLKQKGTNYSKFLSGESSIRVENLLKLNTNNKTFAGPSDVWFTFDCLMGNHIDFPPATRDFIDHRIKEIDREIRFKDQQSET
ncbi:uncharacterized protein LOC134715333 [Mytilus trossulus]|uniref:uncharacterized protein LOC134715333 n=1 Tax=Mytilus trossulus TaxID=6551 RepID=UPI003005E26F